MRNALVYLPLAVIGLAAVAVLYRIAEPSHLYVAADNTTLLSGMATEIKAANLVLTPTATPYHSPTPRPTEKPPTETPLPTWSAGAAPGVYAVPAWTEVPAAVDEVDTGLKPCQDVTPEQWKPVNCEVGA